MADLTTHWAYLEGEWLAARAAPLSQRKALLVALLVDAFVDRVAKASAADDILVFRAQQGASAPALRLVMDLAMQRTVRLVIEAVPVPIGDYGTLGVEDFMVSLYNDHSVPRLLIVDAEGTRLDAHLVLAEAIAGLRGWGAA